MNLPTSPLDTSSPRSLINLLPPELKPYLANLQERDMGMSEAEFNTQFGGFAIDPFVNRIRLEFWREYDEAQNEMRRMQINNIAFRAGAQIRQITRAFENGVNMTWILIAPGSYESFLDESLNYGLARLRKDILGAPVFDGQGNFDARAADLLLKAVAFLDMRKNGGIVSKNLHIVKRADDIKAILPDRSLEDIQKRIEELRGRGVVAHALEMVQDSVGQESKISGDAQENKPTTRPQLKHTNKDKPPSDSGVG